MLVFSLVVTVHCAVFKWFCTVFANIKLNRCTISIGNDKEGTILNQLGIVNNVLEWVNLIIVQLCVPLFYAFFMSYFLVWSVKTTIEEWFKHMYITTKDWINIYISELCLNCFVRYWLQIKFVHANLICSAQNKLFFHF